MIDSKIVPYKHAGPCKTATIYGVDVDTINEKLGFRPNVKDDDTKVKYSWGFLVDGDQFGIWDYKSYGRAPTEFSAYGDKAILAEIFGVEHVR